ncbi:tetratricopeptide repeat protein [bacterium]|nr:tetratricopeptide repeat protein [bacterium]
MKSDLYAYLSGHVPGGLIILLVGLVAFSLIWGFIWNRTRFWNFSRFIAVLVFGWVIIVAGYVVAWKKTDSPPMPIRIIVLAVSEEGNFLNDWQSRATVDLIERRISASPKHFVLQKKELTSVFNRNKLTTAKLDSLALLLKVKWQIKVMPNLTNESCFPVVKIRHFENNTYVEVADYSVSKGSFISGTVSLIGRLMRTLGDDTPPLGPYGLPPALGDDVFKKLYSAISQREAENYDLSTATFKKLIEKYPDWARPRQELALNYLEYYTSYHQNEIHAQLLEAIKIDSSDPESFVLLARYFMKYAIWFEAESATKLAHNLTKDDPRIYFYMSRLGRWRLRNMPLKSKNDYRYQAIYLAPGYEDARLALAESYREEFYHTFALKVIDEGLDIDPDSVPLLMAKTASFLESNHSKEAVELCNELLKRFPGNSTALYNLGIARLYMKQYDLAIALFDSSYRNGGTVENLFYIGVVYQEQGEWEKAIEYYQKRMVLYDDYHDQAAASARDRIKLLKKWIAERDGKKVVGDIEAQ